jgi:hypothetical protein
MNGADSRGFVRYLLRLLSGPLIWFAHFSLLYGAAGFGQALGFAPFGIRAFAWVATLAAGASIFAILWRAQGDCRSGAQEPHRGFHEVLRALAVLSLFGVLLEALALGLINHPA